ncbi:hypothetical protein IFO70_21025 [Phormidium tenue FACHB-886]|nr:hypothetical protein [Phormidium tenue FACHB-886]
MASDITLNSSSVIVEGNIHAGTNTANRMSDKLESLLSEVLPDIEQLLQQYEVLETLRIHLVDLVQPENALIFSKTYIRNGFLQYPCSRFTALSEVPQYDGGLGLDPEKTQQFGTDLAPKLSTLFPRLSQFAQRAGEKFEVHLSINPATMNSEQPMVCKWVNDPRQGNIFQCSKL